MRRVLFVLACLVVSLIPGLVSAHSLPGAPNCPIFPANNSWNQRVDGLPVADNSARLIASISLGDPVHPDFGSGLYNGGPIGIPYAIVSNHTRRVPVRFKYSSESDHGRYPIPPGVPIEGGRQSTGDRHVLLVDKDSCKDYELYNAHPHDGGKRWSAGSGAIFNLRSNHLRPAGWTSADAAGLAILPGLVRWDEVKRGVIDHALRFTAPCTSAAYVYPARHMAHEPSCTGLNPPMGLRVRLKANVDISHLPYQARIVAIALKHYGMMLADNGTAWYISGAPDRHWNNSALHLLDELTGRDFEVVNTSSLPHPGL